MAKTVHADVLDGGLNAIKNGATRMLLLVNYAAGDSYATATAAANIAASATMTSSDFSIANGSNGARVLTTAAKSTTAIAAASTGDGHIAFTDGSAKLLWVTDETGEAPIVVGDTANFPPLTYTSSQPT